jgi:hypothetical protein
MVDYKGNEVVFQSYLTQSAGEVIVTLHLFNFLLSLSGVQPAYTVTPLTKLVLPFHRVPTSDTETVPSLLSFPQRPLLYHDAQRFQNTDVSRSLILSSTATVRCRQEGPTRNQKLGANDVKAARSRFENPDSRRLYLIEYSVMRCILLVGIARSMA